MKKIVRLTENDLHRIIKESVNRTLNEICGSDYLNYPRSRSDAGNVKASSRGTSPNNGNGNAGNGYNKGIYDDSTGDDLRASRGVMPNSLIHDDGDASALRFARSRFGRRY